MQAEPSASSSLIGQTFDNKFRIVRLIGRGGMGEVFEAEHAQLGKRVAVKLMLEKYMGDREAVARFTREALAAGRIGDPHIIDVLDIGTAPDGRAYVVMELLTGQPLSRLIEDHGPLPLNRAIKIMRQVLRAVGAAHTKGIVHRDLKPDNIFLTSQGEQQDFVKLLDFGISKIVDPEMAAAATKLTTTGVVMGTPLYMAPEQAMGNEIDHHADIYACGVIFYEMIAGKPPFEGNTYAVLVAKLLTTDAPLLSEVREGLPPRLVAAIHRALEKEPNARHAHADAFLLALPATQSGSPVELAGTVASGPQAIAVPVPGAPSSKKNLVIGIGAALAGVAVASVILVKLQSSPSPSTTPDTTQTSEKVKPITANPTSIELSVTPADAIVTLDNDPKHTYRDTQSIVVEPGKHDIKVELAGYLTQTRTVTLGDGQTDKQSFALIQDKAVVSNTPPAKVDDKADHPGKPNNTKKQTNVKAPEVKQADTGPKAPEVKATDRTPDKMVEGSDGYTPPPPIKKDPPTTKKDPPETGPDRKPNPY